MDMVEQVARAIQEADDACSFSMKLIRLVDGVSTYSLRYGDGMYLEFEDQDELYEHVRQRKAQARARAAIAAMRGPENSMLAAGYRAMFVDKWTGDQAPMMGAGWDAMLDAALGGNTDAA